MPLAASCQLLAKLYRCADLAVPFLLSLALSWSGTCLVDFFEATEAVAALWRRSMTDCGWSHLNSCSVLLAEAGRSGKLLPVQCQVWRYVLP